MVPFPDSLELDLGFNTGPIILPASTLAETHINQRCDVLSNYKIRLLTGDSGCKIIPKAVSSLMKNIFNIPNQQIVGVIGPTCSEVALEMGSILAHSAINLLHISPGTTSPLLANTTNYPNTFRPLSSSLAFMRIYLELIEHKKIKKLAILFEHINPVYVSAANSFQKKITEEFEDVSVAVGPISEVDISFKNIRNKYRLIFVFGGKSISKKLLCFAYYENIIYPYYQFFFSEITLYDLLISDVSVNANGTKLTCSGGAIGSQMMNATIGIILSEFELVRRDTYTPLVGGSTAEQFYIDYCNALHKPPFLCHLSSHQTNYYDSVWAYALALNASIARLESDLNLSLDSYSYGHGEITDIIRSELLKVRFEGTRGTVTFSNRTHDGEEVAQILLIIIDDSIEQTRIAGVFNPAKELGLKISITLPEAFIPDSFEKVLIVPSFYVEIAVFVLVGLIAVTLVIFHIINTILWTNRHSIKATSPPLNNLIFSGCYLYLLSIMSLSFQEIVGNQNPAVYSVKCSSFIWCESLAFSLIFGTICVKSYRILYIFTNSGSLQAAPRLDTNLLLLYICMIVLIDVVFNITWNMMSPWQMVTRETDSEIALSCTCDHLFIWISVLLTLKGLLTVAVLSFSIATRRVSKVEYKQTKSTNILVYVYILVNSLLFPIFVLLLTYKSVIHITLSYLVVCLKNMICVLMCIFLVFLPPILPILAKKKLTK